MPNWCYNSMKITGTISEITRFKQTCIRTDENKLPSRQAPDITMSGRDRRLVRSADRQDLVACWIVRYASR